MNSEFRGIAVNDIRGLFPKDLHEWLTWIQDGKTLYLNKEKVQNLIAQQRTNFAEVSYLDLNSINGIIQNFENTSPDLQKSRKGLHQQVNPIVRDGKVRDEYADIGAWRHRQGGKGYSCKQSPCGPCRSTAGKWNTRKASGSDTELN